jgi:hypothetical protein
MAFSFAVSLRGVVMSVRNRRVIPCFQVSVVFAFSSPKPVLVSATVKQQKAPAFLVKAGLPFGSPLKYRRFFRSEKEASVYAAYINKVYANRIGSGPVYPWGQQSLF